MKRFGALEGEDEEPSFIRRGLSAMAKAGAIYALYAAVFLFVQSTLVASILLIRNTSSTSAFSNISNSALDLIPGVAFLHSMQIYEEIDGQKDKWQVRLAPLTMDSRTGDETEYRLSVFNDVDPSTDKGDPHDSNNKRKKMSSISSSSVSSISSSSSSSNHESMDKSNNSLLSNNSDGTCSLRESKEKKASPVWNNTALETLASLFEDQMKRRVLRRTAAAAAAAAAQASTGSSTTQPAITRANLPFVDTDKFTIKVKEALPMAANFSWLFKFEDNQYCLLLNTLYSAFSDRENQATLFLTSSADDFKILAGLLTDAGYLTSA